MEWSERIELAIAGRQLPWPLLVSLCWRRNAEKTHGNHVRLYDILNCSVISPLHRLNLGVY
jgi:hypothetical protein